MKASYQPVKFGGHRQFRSGVIVSLVYHVISQDHLIKGYLILWVGASHGKSPPCHVCWP